MSKNYLTEAFNQLEELNEDMFSFDVDGASKLKAFMDGDSVEEPAIDIIDPNATTEDDIEESYVGKVIVMCDVCHSMVYKAAQELTIDDETDMVNVGEECPYCASPDGFKIIGQVAAYTTEEPTEETKDEPVEEEPIEEPVEEEPVEEAVSSETLSDKLRKKVGLEEAMNKVSVETDENVTEVTADGDKVTVTTEPKETVTTENAEVIAPIDPELQAEIETANEEPEQDETIDEEEIDVDFDEFDESEFDELGEGYLKRVYENVDSFKTTKGTITGNQMKLEGVISFKSGKKANTAFIFESHIATKRGKVKFLGENAKLSNNKKAFTLQGQVKDKKLILENLTYNYNVRENNKANHIYGRINKA